MANSLCNADAIVDALNERRRKAHKEYNFAMEQAYANAVAIVRGAKKEAPQVVEKVETVVETVEKLPEWRQDHPAKDVRVLVCVQLKSGERKCDLGYYNGIMWMTRGMAKVVAWMPLPEVLKDD